MDCLATSIFPVKLLLCFSSPFLLFIESDLGFVSIIEALDWLVCAMAEFYEYMC